MISWALHPVGRDGYEQMVRSGRLGWLLGSAAALLAGGCGSGLSISSSQRSPAMHTGCSGVQGDVGAVVRAYFVGVTPPSHADDLLVGQLQRAVNAGGCPVETEAGPVTTGSYAGGTLLSISVLDTSEGGTAQYRAFLRRVDTLLESKREVFLRFVKCDVDSRPCRALLAEL